MTIDPIEAAQVLDARLAREIKQCRELAHIAEQTRVQADQNVERWTLVRRRIRVIFGDELPPLEGEAP